MDEWVWGGYFRTAESRHSLAVRCRSRPHSRHGIEMNVLVCTPYCVWNPRRIDKYLILTIAGRATCLTMDTSYRLVPRKVTVTVSVSVSWTCLGPGEQRMYAEEESAWEHGGS